MWQRMDEAQARRLFSRALIIGPPNSWKTSSLATWPEPVVVLSYPGELGSASLPESLRSRAKVWVDDPAHPMAPGQVYRAVREATVAILSGAEGPVTTFAGDGLHKLYGVIYEAMLAEAIQANPKVDPTRLEGPAYGAAHREMTAYIRLIAQSPVPYLVMTAWVGRDKDDPDDPSRNASTHLWPDLPGQLAQRVLGEFGCVLYAQPGRQLAPGRYAPGTWQTRPGGRVWGVGIKLPADRLTAVPALVPQDWRALERLVFPTTPTATTKEDA